MIEIRNLSKHYGPTRAVDDVSLVVEEGTITALVGTSGSGKSTLLRLVNRLIEPTSGQVAINGTDTRQVPTADLRRRIGYVIQNHGLFPHWTVARNVATVPRLLGWPKAKTEARVAELLSLLSLDPDTIGPRFPHQLSGGQAQRVGVARALAARPELLLMDEPFGALDPVLRGKAQADLRQIQAALGTTVILVTHDMSEAIGLGHRIAVMRAGRLEQHGTPAEILSAPATDFVRDLVGEGERAFRYLALSSVADLTEPGEAPGPPIAPDRTAAQALNAMIWTGAEALPVAGGGRITRHAVLAAGHP
ncbi:ABC transporter ATP-binding protein [Falsirhodobacter algicola]|uniref:ATP-binding cassette domain-containing protein n=1 Tax=Falsirhodobacter algicola TaxID=2692330 RepID=A0A8J8MT76_9RHOB|nr:ABC transporter ATP-binding protein [Falsirhodobacter algicola]QUS36245.1 ATP-binding cassette domain-containing protein [Falsirhodobacter algicola]